MICRLYALVTGLILSSLFAAPSVASHWARSSQDNNSVSNAHFFQQGSVAVSDGEGGVIVAWQDLRNELYFYIYAQRINANGDPLWTTDGVLLSTAGSNQQVPEIVSDGAGGAIVLWSDQRADASDLYAQRINASGNVLWTPTGVPIAVVPNLQILAKAIADGVGGAIVTWSDQRSITNTDIYAQRVDAGGVVQWTANGVQVTAATGLQQKSTLATDRAQGAIIAWEDFRSDPMFPDVYAQRVLANGTKAWTANGVPVAVLAWAQRNPVVSYAVGSGAYVTWEDSRPAGTDFHIYYQRLFSTGAPAFAVNGIKVSSTASGDNYRPQIVDASSTQPPSGMTQYIVWEHETAGGAKELMLNEVGPSGFVLIEQEINFGDGDKLNPHVRTSEEGGGVLISWTSDSFYGPGASNIFVTKYHGSFEFSEAGVAACRADGGQGPAHVVSDYQGGAILAWDDRRDGVSDSDIRAQRVDFLGFVGYGSADITSIVDQPQDQGLHVVVSWDKSYHDTFEIAVDASYSVWRRYQNPAAIAEASLGAERAMTEEARLAHAIEAGVSREVATEQIASGWELAGTVPAVGLPSYALTATTYGDYIDASSPRTGFMVIFDTDVGNWFSAADSGSSVDNFAPTAPLSLVGSTAGMDAQLNWVHPLATPDVSGYHVYRSSLPGVAVTPGNRIATVENLDHLDTTIGGHPHYYVVTAVDDAEQEGPPSNEVRAPIGVTGVDIAAPGALSLTAAGGNPFRERATFRYGLPVDSEVSILVYDVNGRQVHDARMGRVPAGWHEYRLDGKDDTGRRLGTGTYFLRLQAGVDTRVLKFVMLR